MKTLKFIATGIVLLAATSVTQAQVSINVNIGAAPVVVRPTWVPQNHINVDFYYLPEIQAYFDVNASLYVYLNNGNWHRSRYLPVQYRNYDLVHAHRVPLRGYHGSRPYTYFNNHKVKYNDRYYNNRFVEGRRYNNKRYDNRYDRHYADNCKSNYNNGNHYGYRHH